MWRHGFSSLPPSRGSNSNNYNNNNNNKQQRGFRFLETLRRGERNERFGMVQSRTRLSGAKRTAEDPESAA